MRSTSTFELLESRRLASVSLNTNLVVNGNAEAGPASESASTAVSIPGWTTNGLFTVMKYNTVGFLLESDTIPADHGKNFFSGGRVGPVGGLETTPTATQIINVSEIARDIDAGIIGFDLSASLGGFGTENDTMNIELTFADANRKVLNTVSLNGPTAAMRGNKSGLQTSGQAGSVPVGTRLIGITLKATHTRGYVADGYADNISLKLSSTMTDANLTGIVFNDVNGDGKQNAGEKGLAGAVVTAQFPFNGRVPPIATTDANGRYTLTDVPAGKVTVAVNAPPGFRKTRPNTQSFNAVAGLTSTVTQPFAFTERALISGSVIRDPNSSPIFDDQDNGIAGIRVWLDTNGNGKLDRGERSTTTDQDGNFRFTVTRGRYNVRVAGTNRYQQVTPAKSKPIKLTLGKGGSSIGNVFSMVQLPE